MEYTDLPRLLLAGGGEATAPDAAAPPPRPLSAPFRPGVAIVIAVLTSVFSLTFLMLLYARHCKRSDRFYSGAGGEDRAYGSTGDRPRRSGVDRAVVESLPVFRFGALEGEKDGLECAVCLGKFEPAEALRLLPKCRHGFHVECVDTWLDAHSTCPLCRARVDPEDVLLLPSPPTLPVSAAAPSTTPTSDAAPSPAPAARRISGRHSTGSLQITVHPPPTRRSAADGAGCFDLARVRKDRVLMADQTPAAAAMAEMDKETFERRFSHRIVVGGEPAVKERWSDLRPSDLFFLRAEFIGPPSSDARAAARASWSAAGNRGRSSSELPAASRLAPSRGADRRWLGAWLRGLSPAT